ncbi:trinucleotide repeat-containing gene 18 protein-like [Frankliniella occidentalis]|uniref:Trinucleotide repeat-containing gene 18 protein-like n=1 Tax=Frankliniella occidentalis TaxID=133901 RepID=A0A9C6X478_FRAOC|nr:trinucleotide repeat-containing gene 18 protein-like [Frankliniella occidentalis]
MTVPGPYLPPDKVYEEATPQVRLAAQRAQADAERTSTTTTTSSSRTTSHSDPAARSCSSSCSDCEGGEDGERDEAASRTSGTSRASRRQQQLEELCCEFLLRHRINPELLCAYRGKGRRGSSNKPYME